MQRHGPWWVHVESKEDPIQLELGKHAEQNKVLIAYDLRIGGHQNQEASSLSISIYSDDGVSTIDLVDIASAVVRSPAGTPKPNPKPSPSRRCHPLSGCLPCMALRRAPSSGTGGGSNSAR
jgi:hypothetical protein